MSRLSLRRVTSHARGLTVLLPLLSLTGALALSGCANREQTAPSGAAPTSAAAAFPVEVTPPGGKPVRLAQRPQRVISLTPTGTEMLYALGAGQQVVAVDDQSNFPANAPRAQLSGFKPNVEAIAGYNPDLVVASNDIDNMVASLDKVKVPVLVLTAAKTLDESYAQMTLLGQATGHSDDARDLVRRTQDDIGKVVRDTPKPAKPLKYFHELDPSLYTVTSKTFLGQVYSMFGLTNIADTADATGGGYPQISAEQVLGADPDLVFLADTKCCGQNAQTVGARPGWQSVAAVRGDRVVALDDDVASRWGPRIVDLVSQVANVVTRASKQSG